MPNRLLWKNWESHPAWGAWIEIRYPARARGQIQCRTPHGVRGLKLLPLLCFGVVNVSHPAWGAWIEIMSLAAPVRQLARSHPAWGAWIEMLHILPTAHFSPRSHPAWGAWIEICAYRFHGGQSFRRTPHGVRGLKLMSVTRKQLLSNVAPRMGCVD